MIGLKGTLNVIDNSGAIVAECIRVMSGARFARAGKYHCSIDFDICNQGL